MGSLWLLELGEQRRKDEREHHGERGHGERDEPTSRPRAEASVCVVVCGSPTLATLIPFPRGRITAWAFAYNVPVAHLLVVFGSPTLGDPDSVPKGRRLQKPAPVVAYHVPVSHLFTSMGLS